MTSYRLERARDPQDLARRASEYIATAIQLALDQRDRAQIALSGGTTPSQAYRRLGQQHLPWNRVDVFLGDERWVSAVDESSNARMLRATLLLAGEPGAAARVRAPARGSSEAPLLPCSAPPSASAISIPSSPVDPGPSSPPVSAPSSTAPALAGPRWPRGVKRLFKAAARRKAAGGGRISEGGSRPGP